MVSSNEKCNSDATLNSGSEGHTSTFPVKAYAQSQDDGSGQQQLQRVEAVTRMRDNTLKELRRRESLSIADVKSIQREDQGHSEDGYKVRETETHVIKVRENETKHSAMQNRVLQLVAGGLAGAVTKTAVAPLERVKILMQVQGMKEGSVHKYKTIPQTLRVVIKEEGFRGLYQGNGANVLRVVPVYGLKFAFNDTFKDMVRTPGESLTFVQLISAGTLAGLFQTCVTYPLETVRTRLTLGPGLGIHYNGIMDVLRTTVRTEGVGGLYKGIGPTFLSGSPYVGLQMTFFEVLKGHIPEDEWYTPASKLMAGAAAGVVAQTLTYPGDTIRRRMQTNGIKGEAKVYTNSWDCMMKIIRNEGAATLFSGLRANLVRALPGAAIQFYAYDSFKAMLGC